MSTTANLATRPRIIGIDVVRFLAIVGMMAAHLLGLVGPAAGRLETMLDKAVGATVSSTAATTFAVLGGVSLILLSRSMRGRSRLGMLGSIALRGIYISAIGFALEQLHGPVSVVLTAYGVSMIIAAPALLLRSWVVAALAGVLWLCGGVFNASVRTALAAGFVPNLDPTFAEQAATFARDMLLTGHYPAITWVAYMLTGILIARLLLNTEGTDALRRLCLRLAIWGLAVYTVTTGVGRLARMRPAWFGIPPELGEIVLRSNRGAPQGMELWMLLIPAPHTGTITDMLRTVAGACFLIGLFVWLCDVQRRQTGRVLSVIRAAGAAPLTIYSAHVVVSALALRAVRDASLQVPPALPWFADGLLNFGAQLIGVLAIGAVLAALNRRGPLESLLGRASGSRRRGSSPPSARTPPTSS